MSKLWPLVAMLAVCVPCGVGVYFWAEHYQTPTVREKVEAPLYSVGTGENVTAVLQGRQVVKFGPLPASAFYAGSVAFRTAEEALEWLTKVGKYDQGWRVFETSGDFELDTHLVRGLPYTNKTLLFVREVPVHP